ncbi:hypothetical protein MQA28_26150, partial [Escherichia coli]|nr:hypothetical protein [Escherichia coli]
QLCPLSIADENTDKMKAVFFIVVALLVTAECKSMRDKKRQAACGALEFQCPSGTCIQEEWLCDTDNDCGDNADEVNCPTDCTGEHQFHCGGGLCIAKEFECDGIRDCFDGSDEAVELCRTFVCSPGEVKCPNTYICIDSSRLCDGRNNCRDRWDENPANCPVTAAP